MTTLGENGVLYHPRGEDQFPPAGVGGAARGARGAKSAGRNVSRGMRRDVRRQARGPRREHLHDLAWRAGVGPLTAPLPSRS